MTKILLWSDLHDDVWHQAKAPLFALPDPMPPYDVLVVAGDVGEDAVKSVRWIADRESKKPVIFIQGNHEGYRHTIDKDFERARAEAKAFYPNIYVLENETVVACGVRFVCATLWTSYELMRADNRDLAMMHASNSMNDHRLIRVAAKEYRRFLPSDALAKHNASVAYITRVLEEPFAGPTVVVTHHAPCIKSVPARYWGDLLNAAYASHLDHLVDKSTVWVHGHIHTACRYKVGDGEVICNPRGYPHETSGFDPCLIIEV